MITIIGNILGSSGYDSHTRNLFNALNKLEKVKLLTNIPQGAERLLSDKELEAIKTKDELDIGIIITNPLFWRLNLNYKRNWVYLVFEGDKIPVSYMKECLNDEIEYILVPSNHTKQAILNTFEDYTLDKEKDITYNYIINKIKVIPHGVNLDLFYPKEKPTNFRFLINKGFRNLEDRGGAQYGIKAYLEEFTNQDNIELILHINPAYGIPDLNKLLNEIAPKRTNLPRLTVTADNIPYDKLVNLYNQAHVLVAPSRADAFNIPGIEAMACGLPVITTNFGGQTDYCNKDNSWIVGGELVEIKHELLYENIKWLTPNIDELRRAMRNAFEFERIRHEKSKNALQTAKSFQWDNSALKILELK